MAPLLPSPGGEARIYVAASSWIVNFLNPKISYSTKALWPWGKQSARGVGMGVLNGHLRCNPAISNRPKGRESPKSAQSRAVTPQHVGHPMCGLALGWQGVRKSSEWVQMCCSAAAIYLASAHGISECDGACR